MKLKDKGQIRRVVGMVMKLKPSYFILLVISRINSTCSTFLSIILGAKILDMLIEKAPKADIIRQAVILITTKAFLTITYWAMQHTLDCMKREMTEKMYQMICDKTLKLDYEVLEKKETLEMIQKAEDGMNNHGGISVFCGHLAGIVENVIKIISAIVLLIGILVPNKSIQYTGLAKFMNAWYSFLPLAAVIIFYLTAGYFLYLWADKHEQKAFEQKVKLNHNLGYLFSFVTKYQQGKYIRLYRMQDMLMRRIKHDMDKNEHIFISMRKKLMKKTQVNFLLQSFVSSSCYLYVGLKAITGLISVGDVMKYVSTFQEFNNSFSNLISSFVELQIISRYLSYFSDFMELENKKYEGTLPVEKREDNQYEIEFKDVSFHYPNNDKVVLSHVNVKLLIGEKTAVVGMNGAGKTTFIKLLCRLYDPTEGEIFLNDVNIKYYDYKEYLRLFAVVFQDFCLFSFPLADNVAASMKYDEEKVKHSLIQAGFGDRLSQMPEGIHTNLYQMDDKGVEISGGEAQKIAIARALYKDAPFVILDEPTSALDPVAEYDIYKRFDELVKNKTSVYISHRMSSCRFCQNIIVFDEGKIVQRGSHEELLKDKTGRYYELWEAQAKYYQNAG